ncbi:hypothetical protein ES703_123829 [subsurface metagenome]
MAGAAKREPEDLSMIEVSKREPNIRGGEDLPKTTATSLAGIRRIRCLLGTVFALVVADGLISNFLMTHGLAREWNPYLQTLVTEDSFLLIKVAGALICTLLLWDIYKKQPQIAMIGTVCIVVLYTGLLYWNLGVFFAAQV